MSKRLVKCAVCGGTGKEKDEQKSTPFKTVKKPCSACNGSGKVQQK
jgi:DnaJ-class molecular chaperone